MIQIENQNSVLSKISIRVIVLSGLLILVMLSIFINPDNTNSLNCHFRELTGYPCPTCGLSHSLYAISHFHIKESLYYHPMGPFVYFALIFLLLKFSLELIFRITIKIDFNSPITKIMLFIFSFSWLGVWIIRLVTKL